MFRFVYIYSKHSLCQLAPHYQRWVVWVNLTSRSHHQNTKPLASFFSLSTYAGLNQASICRYEDNLTFAKRVGTRKGLVFGMGTGLFWAIMFLAFAASFYFGVILIQNDGLQPGNVLVVSEN